MNIDFTPDTPARQIQFQPDFNDSMAGLSHSQMLVDSHNAAQKAQQEAQSAQSPMGIAGETVKQTGKGLVQTFLDPAAKFIGSALRAPIDIFKGAMGQGTMTDTFKLPSGAETKSIQGEVFSGQTGIGGALLETGEGALDILGAKGLSKVAEKPLQAVSGLLNVEAKKSIEEKATKTTIKALTPKLTTAEIRAAAKSGQGTVSKFKGAKIDPTKDAGFMKTVNAVKGIVTGKSPIEDINSVRGALSTEAESLKNQIKAVDHPYSFKELASKLTNAEEPISLRGTPFEKQVAPVKQAAINLAQKAGGTISGLLDARKAFDQLVDKEYPNLWDKESAPMKNAIRSIRNAMNDFIEANLPKGNQFKQSLDLQKSFYDAIDYLGTKVPSELRTGGALKKFIKNPVVQTIGSGLIGAGAVETGKKLLGE